MDITFTTSSSRTDDKQVVHHRSPWARYQTAPRNNALLRRIPTIPRDFMRRTRLLCDSLYYVFLSGYRSGLEAYWNRSMERSKVALRESTPRWHNAKISAGRALEEAKSAWNLRQENKIEESNASAERALQFLVAR
jgi:hypothetical protein